MDGLKLLKRSSSVGHSPVLATASMRLSITTGLQTSRHPGCFNSSPADCWARSLLVAAGPRYCWVLRCTSPSPLDLRLCFTDVAAAGETAVDHGPCLWAHRVLGNALHRRTDVGGGAQEDSHVGNGIGRPT